MRELRTRKCRIRKRIIAYMLFATILLSNINICTVEAATTGKVFATGETLSSGTYIVTKSQSIAASSGGSGLYIASGATVILCISENVTLTVKGGNASGTTRGGAGIYVPSNATLIITGKGTLNATGGNGANGGTGTQGDCPYTVNSTVYLGGSSSRNGQGGNGGGGAGAGIGGYGGTGGNGGTGYTLQTFGLYYQGTVQGGGGYSGGAGGSGSTNGTVIIMNEVTVNATGGLAGQYGVGGSAGNIGSFSLMNVGGGGAGGGGGYGSAASDIGGGGAGGGGGGAGGHGGTYGYNGDRYLGAGGNSGGGGAPYGTAGTKGSDNSNWCNKGNQAGLTTGGTGGQKFFGNTVTTGINNEAGGNGGNSGSNGGNGNIYRNQTSDSRLAYTLTFQKQSGTGGTTSTTVYLGKTPSSITIPVRAGYIFNGYSTAMSSSETGVKYYNADGTGIAMWDMDSSATLYADWIAKTYTTTLTGTHITGGITFGTGKASTGSSWSGTLIPATHYHLPNQITVAVENTVLDAESDYIYDSVTGNVTVAESVVTGNITVLADAIPNDSTFQIDLSGGAWSESDEQPIAEHTPVTGAYGTTVKIPNPVKAGNTFGGWLVEGASDSAIAITLGGYNYTYGSETEPVTLTAIWRESSAVEVVDNSQFTIDAEQLQNLFDSSNLVTESDKGITEEDIRKGSVRVSVEVTDKTGGTEGDAAEDMAAIQEAAGKSAPYFFDITVTKTVTPEGGDTPEEAVILTELPREAPAKIVIDVTGTELEGKSSFYVYRYHNGRVEQLSYRDIDGEFYTVTGNIITIYTRKFSTYAVTAGEVSMEGADSVLEGNNQAAVDVQGKVDDGTKTAIYKLDVTWGAMKFEYGAAKTEWDPETHAYVTAGENAEDMGWVKSGFENGNNQIIVSNHSNADLLMSFTVQKQGTGMDTVDMEVCQENRDEAAPATGITLSKVPQEEAEAPYQQAWLRISGTPSDLGAYQTDIYIKAAVITLSVEAVDSSLTPRKQ